MNAALAAGLSGGTSLLGSVLQAASVGATNATNKKIAQMQNQWNLEQWYRENEYNLPSSQMARLRAAGLNPNLVYQNGGASTAAASSPRAAELRYQAPNLGLDSVGPASVNAYMAFKQYEMDREKTVAQVELAKQQTEVARQEAFNRSLVGIKLGLQNNLTRQTTPYQIASAQAQAQRLAAGNILLDDQHALNLQQYDLRERAQAAREEALYIQWQRATLEQQRVNLSAQEYNLRKWNLENQERRARKTFNMSWQDWNDMRFGKIGNTYLKFADPFIKAYSAYMRRSK